MKMVDFIMLSCNTLLKKEREKEKMKYRKLSEDDAEQFWNLMNQLDYETKYMLYEPGERTKNLPEIEAIIRDSVEGEDFLLVAETDNRLVGYLSA